MDKDSIVDCTKCKYTIKLRLHDNRLVLHCFGVAEESLQPKGKTKSHRSDIISKSSVTKRIRFYHGKVLCSKNGHFPISV